MNPQDFALDPSVFGIPNRQQLLEYRIWDSHYHGFLTSREPIEMHKRMMFYVERMGIERVIALDVGGTLKKPLSPSPYDEEILKMIKNNKDKLSAITPIDPGYPHESCDKMEEWIRNGPGIGIKYVGGNELGVTCDHPNSDRIIQLAAELGAVIYIHTWIKVGGSPRVPGKGNLSGESTPMDVAKLARRFPDVQMICGHAGGDWEMGVRAIRAHENVLLEFSGGDPNSGSVDFAVNELGADRIVWGGHGPSRSYATELSKVLDASITHSERMKIFGENYRKLAEDIFRKKSLPIKV
ncbi:MAG: amidohydrolase family protein [Balneolales bacterium]